MTKPATRIYVLRNKDTNEERLVRAANPSQVLKLVSRPYTAEAASADDVARLLQSKPGVEIENASDESEPEVDPRQQPLSITPEAA